MERSLATSETVLTNRDQSCQSGWVLGGQLLSSNSPARLMMDVMIDTPNCKEKKLIFNFLLEMKKF